MTVRRGGRAAAALIALCLCALTIQALAGAPAGATGQGTAQSARQPSSSRLVVHPPPIAALNSTTSAAASAQAASMATPSTSVAATAQAVAPLPSSSPACYGDAHSTSQTGSSLIPVSFGAFFYCNSQTKMWTFEVQTRDTWARTAFGDWTVFMIAGGGSVPPPTNLCQGQYNYAAQYAQTAQGTFVAKVGPVGSSCTPTGAPTGTSGTINGSTATVSLPWSAIGSATSIVWVGALQSFTEEANKSGAAFVPCAGEPACSQPTPGQYIPGAVVDSVPPPTAPASCAAGATSTQVATLSDPFPATETLATVDQQAVTALSGQPGFSDVRDYGGEGVISFTGSATTAQSALTTALGAGAVQHIAPSQSYAPEAIITSGVSSTPTGSNSYLGAIGATGAQPVTSGNSVVVADIDTGVDYLQPNLSANLRSGFDESTGTAMSSPSNTDTGQIKAGDGTATAGVITSVMASVGLKTGSVLPVKVNFDDTAHASAEIDAGIRWAADNGAQIINLSLGGVCPDPNLLSAIQYAQNKGDLLVAAAGNGAVSPTADPSNGTGDALNYPADDAGVVAVGATGGDGLRASYSNTGAYVGMAAPGGSDISLDPGDDLGVLAPTDQCRPLQTPTCYTTGAGTGLAAAQVSAEAALIWAVNPPGSGAPPSGLTASQVRELVESTTTDQGVTGTDLEYGTGMETVGVALADTPPPSVASQAAQTYGTYTPLAPFRILDTRNGTGTGGVVAQLGSGRTLPLLVTGACPPPPGTPACINGSPNGVPQMGVSAVVLNVTITNPTATSFLTVWPAGQPQPNTSNLDFTSKTTRPNLVTVKVGSSGHVDIFNSAGAVDVIADVAGYYSDSTGPLGSTFVPVSPIRILDTRNTLPVSGGVANARTLTVAGIDWQNPSPVNNANSPTVPNGSTGVVLNVTVTGSTALSNVSILPAAAPLTAPPSVSNLNFTAGQTVPNLVNVALPIGTGTAGAITIFNSQGKVQVIVDLEGYFTAPADRASGSRFFPVVPHRILDTRANIGGFSAPIGANQSISVPVTGQGGVLDGSTDVVMNTTVTGPTAQGVLIVFPSNLHSTPTASNLNYTPGLTAANLVSVPIGKTDGKDKFYNSAGTVQAIADAVGWYGPPGS